jgi:hypothetical protein
LAAGALDEHGREVMAMTAARLEALKKQEAKAEGMTLAALISGAATIPFNVFIAAARALIGPTCPASRGQMVAQLRLLPGGNRGSGSQKFGGMANPLEAGRSVYGMGWAPRKFR